MAVVPFRRPSPELVAARMAEVAKRYRRHASIKGKRPRTIAAIRASELTRLYDDRWGPMLLPNADDGLLAARIMVHHVAALRDAPRRMANWLMTCTPWMRMAERERLISEATECPLRWGADKLGWKLRVTDEERTRLKLTTIGAIDVSRDERLARRVARKRQRDAKRRPKAAKQPSPWTAAGVSRATWYRRLKR